MGPEAAASQSNAEKTIRPAATKTDDFLQYNEHGNFNFSLFLLWITTILAIGMSFFFWWSDYSLKQRISEKSGELTAISAEISSSEYAGVETEAAGLQSAVSVLSKAYRDRISLLDFNQTLNSKINGDIQVTSISVSLPLSTVTIAGKTGTYRQVADQMVALQSWNALTEVDLGSVIINSESKDAKTAASFTISAKIDGTKLKADNNTDSISSGGTNEPIL